MNAWLNLRQLIDTIGSDSEFRALDDRSQRLLEWIIRHHSPERPLFVQAIVLKSEVASPATVHKCLSVLERAEMISVKVDPDDTRRRIVSPTDRAKKLMSRLSRQVKVWAEALSD